MRYRDPKKESNLFIMIEHRQAVLKAIKGINKLRSGIRVRCEHVFGRMTQLAMDRLRTIGLLRSGQHNTSDMHAWADELEARLQIKVSTSPDSSGEIIDQLREDRW